MLPCVAFKVTGMVADTPAEDEKTVRSTPYGRELDGARPMRWLLAIAAVALVLRLIRLGTHSYWRDEAFNLVKAQHFGAVLRGDLVSNHPPLFTALVAFWRIIGLDGNEWLVRLLPVILGMAGVFATYALGKVMLGSRAGLTAAFLVAISPFHVHHSQDLKEYILLPLTGTLAVYFLYLAVEKNRVYAWTLYTLTAALACYSDLFAILLLIAINLWALAQCHRHSDRLSRWLMANIAGALLFLPQLDIMLARADLILLKAQSWWIPRPTLWSFLFYLKTIAFGYSDQKPLFPIALTVFCLFALIGIALSFRKKCALSDASPALVCVSYGRCVSGVRLLTECLSDPGAVAFRDSVLPLGRLGHLQSAFEN